MKRAAALLVLFVSCKDPPAPAAAPDAEIDAIDDAPMDVAALDGRADAVKAAREMYADGGTWNGSWGRTTTIQTSVMSLPAWSEDGGTSSVKLGYLRTASPVPLIDGIVSAEGCSEGWYELVEGGWVCAKHITLDAADPKLKWVPGPADLQSKTGLPYKVGVVLFDGTPMYKRALPLEKREKYEPWLHVKPSKSSSSSSSENPYDEDNNNDDDDNNGDVVVPKNQKLRGKDGGKPTLGELQGRGSVIRKMMRGFLLSGDKEVELQGAKWWRTSIGNLVPTERVMAYAPLATPHGGFFPTGSEPATSGAVVKIEGAAKYTADTEKKSIGTAGLIAKNTPIGLVGDPTPFWGVPYQKTTEGFWVKLSDLSLPAPEVPGDLGPDEKWIDVDLGKQIVVAFEGKRAVFVARVSSGRRNPWDAQHDYPTPTGQYHVREKHVTTTMDGDLAADGPYSIEDVPWVMYFKGSFALHGAFWHDDFGHARSHGCINIAPQDARALFSWTEPHLPTGWHGVFARPDRPGTRVVIHEPAPVVK